jgi:hypothetical protein
LDPTQCAASYITMEVGTGFEGSLIWLDDLLLIVLYSDR